MKYIIVLITLLLLLPACGSDAPETSGNTAAPDSQTNNPETQSTEPLEPRMENGVQVVDIEAGELGFVPVSVSLHADVPARLVFIRTTEKTCATEVAIPAFEVGPVELPLGDPVAVEFTPTETGDFRFACGMDMQEGALLVQS
ncbi:MAG: cupredoxin domain-containing protein [Rubricoccaceae bacterium]|nr:cupredoxin domain-containing protein [Rubricoccaceae bacterium]